MIKTVRKAYCSKKVPLAIRLPPHWCVYNFAPREVPKVGCISGFQSAGPRLGASLVPHRLPRVAGATHASVVTVPKMANGTTRKIRNFEHLYQVTNTALGLMTALGVMYPGSGYLVVLGKLLRGSFGTKGEHGTVRKVDQNPKMRRLQNARFEHQTVFGLKLLCLAC